jgi:hypothetical protein
MVICIQNQTCEDRAWPKPAGFDISREQLEPLHGNDIPHPALIAQKMARVNPTNLHPLAFFKPSIALSVLASTYSI